MLLFLNILSVSSVTGMILIGVKVGSSTLNLGTVFTNQMLLSSVLKLPFSFQRVSNKQF